ncbi:MAG: polysaccharide biosynthesis protein, partial [Nevskiaceae bacterium]
WITLQQGVDFVLASFARMQGGELYVPKIPSARITDLARAVAPDAPTRIVGIRPGEKLHEMMCPRDDAHLTLEFADHYVVRPAITFSTPVNQEVNALGERGRPVPPDFEYGSEHNPHFMSVEDLRHLVAQ